MIRAYEHLKKHAVTLPQWAQAALSHGAHCHVRLRVVRVGGASRADLGQKRRFRF